MITRLKTSIFAIALLISVLLFSHTIVLPIGIAIVGIIALYEVYYAAGYTKKIWLSLVGALFVSVYPFALEYNEQLSRQLIFMLIISVFIIQLVLDQKIKYFEMASVVFFAVFIAYTLGTIISIRLMPHGDKLIYLAFMIPWVTDSIAYIFGSAFGKYKLCPTISPNKSVEGAIAGMFGGALCVLLFYWALKWAYGITLSNILLVILGATLCSLAGQIGDLAASMLKRQLGIKDFGNIFPGHGGIMDRFDSVLFAMPVFYHLFLMIIIIS